MLYLMRYKDGFIIGAAGDSPQAAADKAATATARPFADVDAISERDTTFVVYDWTRGWLAPRAAARAGGELVDANTGDVVGLADPEPPAAYLDLDPPSSFDPAPPAVDAPADASADSGA